MVGAEAYRLPSGRCQGLLSKGPKRVLDAAKRQFLERFVCFS